MKKNLCMNNMKKNANIQTVSDLDIQINRPERQPVALLFFIVTCHLKKFIIHCSILCILKRPDGCRHRDRLARESKCGGFTAQLTEDAGVG